MSEEKRSIREELAEELFPALKTPEELRKIREEEKKRREKLMEEVKDIKVDTSEGDLKENFEEIVWDDETPLINPSFDFANNTIFLLHPLKYKKEVNGEIVEVEKSCLIWYDGQRKGIVPFEYILNKKIDISDKLPFNIRLAHTFEIENISFWSRKSIKAWAMCLFSKKDFTIKGAYDKIYEVFDYYMEYTDPRYYTLFTVYTIATYFYPLFTSFPYIYITALPRSGKSKTLKLITFMGFNGHWSVNETVASLFRNVTAMKGVLGIDEAEHYNNNQEVLNLLNSGYEKGAIVSRVEERGGRRVMKRYEVYSPKVIVNIAGLNETTKSRCIPVTLVRGITEKMNREPPVRSDEMFVKIRDYCMNVLFFYYMDVLEESKKVMDYIKSNINDMIDYFIENRDMFKSLIISIDDEDDKTNIMDFFESKSEESKNMVRNMLLNKIEDLIIGRPYQLWKPLFTIAKMTGDKKVLYDLVSLALDIETYRVEEDIAETRDSNLMYLLIEMVTHDGWYYIKDITERMREGLSEREKELIKPRAISNSLRRLGLDKNKKKDRKGAKVWLTVREVKDIAKRMGILSISEYTISGDKHKRFMVVLNEAIAFHKAECEERGEPFEGVPRNYLLEKLREQGIEEDYLEKCLREGIVFEPKPNVIMKV
ncbi:hypothetical protein DRH29_03530 [candidate division Kazan bacterium]|uniref:DUF927 domain-containing protein n=1 Tax=candidate division Kazan bacterium TaxID=2202143 RepID=A0A420ZC89_UNCK3|nr:MAG: hypothetical protein DRH29_03530 [candidate division Kazan bacterium]